MLCANGNLDGTRHNHITLTAKECTQLLTARIPYCCYRPHLYSGTLFYICSISVWQDIKYQAKLLSSLFMAPAVHSLEKITVHHTLP